MNSLNNLKKIKVSELSINEAKNAGGGSFLSTLVSVAVSVAVPVTIVAVAGAIVYAGWKSVE